MANRQTQEPLVGFGDGLAMLGDHLPIVAAAAFEAYFGFIDRWTVGAVQTISGQLAAPKLDAAPAQEVGGLEPLPELALAA